jgi:hypothetical protein
MTSFARTKSSENQRIFGNLRAEMAVKIRYVNADSRARTANVM